MSRPPTKPGSLLFTIAQATRITGVCGRTLRDWCAKGMIVPFRGDGRRGSAILLSYLDLHEIALLAEVRGHLSLARAADAVRLVTRLGWDSPTGTALLDCSGKEPRVWTGDCAGLLSHPIVLFFDVLAIRERVRCETRSLLGLPQEKPERRRAA